MENNNYEVVNENIEEGTTDRNANEIVGMAVIGGVALLGGVIGFGIAKIVERLKLRKLSREYDFDDFDIDDDEEEVIADIFANDKDFEK